MTEKRKAQLEWWKLIIGSVVAILVVLVPLVWNSLDTEEQAPQFGLSSPFFTPKTLVTVYARNDIAQKENNIHVEWDGFLFHHGAKRPQKREVKYSWEFVPENLIKDKALIKLGLHKVRFSFNNSKFSDYLQIRLTEQSIVSIPSYNAQSNSTLTGKSGTRKALVIGNSAYSDYPLVNPVNDARLIAKRLEGVGFNVTLGTNLTEEKTRELLRQYAKKLSENDTSIIYFSGHGVQLDGANYLLPVNANISDARDIERYGISLNQITGLTENLQNQVTLYAASPGTVAMDGGSNSRNSPFAYSLAQNITEPNIELSSAFRKVIHDVDQSTNGLQIPWLHSTASDSIILNKANAGTASESKGQSASIVILDASTAPMRMSIER